MSPVEQDIPERYKQINVTILKYSLNKNELIFWLRITYIPIQ